MKTVTSGFRADTRQSPGLLNRDGSLKAGAFILVLAVLIAFGSPPMALMAGMAFALCVGTPFPRHGSTISKRLLQACVVLLGFGMDLPTVLRAGVQGISLAALTIGGTLLLGYWLGRRLSIHPNTSILISAGTAICGGSAIAAVSSVLVVSESQIAVAMATVFLLNAVALYLFPVLGHLLHLTQGQFGVWSGVAIHDISSVVGAALSYGPEALQRAVAIKLSRTLWIVPMVLVIAWVMGRRAASRPDGAQEPGREGGVRRGGPEIPWFIGLFLLASVARSFIPAISQGAGPLAQVARVGFTVVLGLIGSSLSWKSLKQVGWKATLQGVMLWVFISGLALVAVLSGVRWLNLA